MITGKLTHAGLCFIGEEHVSGIFIEVPKDVLRAVKRLPMYEIVTVETEVNAKNFRFTLNALLAHARRGSPEEKIIAHALGLKPELLQPQPAAIHGS